MQNETTGSETPSTSATDGTTSPPGVSQMAPASDPSPTSSPTNRNGSLCPEPKPRARQFRPVPVYNPAHLKIPKMAGAKPPAGPQIPDHSVRVEYAIRIYGGKEVVADIESKFDLPLALKKDCLGKTDCDFARLLDSIIVGPLVTQFRGFLRDRLELYDKANVKQESVDDFPPIYQPPIQNRKSPMPANGASFLMPEIKAKPPLPKMPGTFAPPPPRGGI